MSSKITARIKLTEAKLRTYFAKIQSIYDRSLTLNGKIEEDEFLASACNVSKLREEFIKEEEELNLLKMEADPEYEPSFHNWDALESLYVHIQGKIQSLSASRPPKLEIPMSTAAPQFRSPHVKLPPIELPKFDGNQKSWPLFYECFNHNIHRNLELTDYEKVYYLCGQLTGKARECIEGITPTGDNYSLIYNTLVDKFQDVRSLGSAYLNEILNLKRLSTPSADGLNSFMDKFAVSVAAFEKLDIADKLDFVFLHLALSKLDCETARLFENSVRGSKIPKYESLRLFVKEQAKILERTGAVPSIGNRMPSQSLSKVAGLGVPRPKPVSGRNTKSFVASTGTSAAGEESQCPLCGTTGHSNYSKCTVFLKLAARERYNIVKKHHGCVLCLSASHNSSACNLKGSCSVCQSKTHHSMLHFVDRQTSTSLPVSTDHIVDDGVTEEFCADVARDGQAEDGDVFGAGVSLCSMQKSETHGSLCNSGPSTVLLATARVRVVDSQGKSHLVRCLIDNGSQNHFVTAKCCERLSLTPCPASAVSVHGFGGSSNPVKGVTELEFSSRFDDNMTYKINPLVVDHITTNLPTASVDTSLLSYLTSVPLADDTFNVPGEIELLIGAQLFAKLLLSGRVHGPPYAPDAVQTTLGFVMMGEAPAQISCHKNQSVAFCAITERPMSEVVNKFWELEEVSYCNEPYLSPEEQECELYYQSTTTRDSTGRYSVSLPFKADPATLGSSEKTAEKRLFALERKFKSSTPLREAYNKVVTEYLENDYLSPVRDQDDRDNDYIIPHHGVIRNDKVTTKLRMVLDASAQTDKGLSLNQLLHAGPNLQGDIFRILLNFRLFSVAFCADVKQMYLQILVHPPFRKYLRMLYRFDPNDELQLFEFKRVCFGLSVSPFLALRTVKQLASDERETFPLAADIVQRDLYMDDVVSSERSVSAASETALQLIGMFKAGGFDLLKWSSNSIAFLANLPETHLHPHAVNFDDGDASQKILGVKWEPRADQFLFEISPCEDKCTKRSILSTVARLWDVLGFAAPVILYAKLLIKDLWDQKIDWDECPPQSIIDKWTTFKSELSLLTRLNIPRHLGVVDNCGTTLLAFADASEKAYGAVIYLRVQTLDEVTVRLVCAKSRVAPLKTVSLARLELCAALLLSKLVRIVLDTYGLRCEIDRVLAFSDSTVALHWIHSSPHRWKAFVANRITKIHENLDAAHFHHVSGKENPADCLSRGLTPAQLIEHPLWFEGPSWTAKEVSQWPIQPFKVTSNLDIPEVKVVSLPSVEVQRPVLYTLAHRISSWPKLLRIVTYVLRFAGKLQSRGLPTATDINEAELAVIRSLQVVYFADIIKDVELAKPVRSSIQKLRPILVDGVLRVGGRLEKADLSFDQKHPMLLPKKDHIVNLIVDEVHCTNCHTGPSLLLSLLRQKYWILSGRNIVRSRVHSCNFCFRARPKTCISPVMADLPKCRLQISKPFAHTGLDYCGPINITLTRKRGIRSQKAYICVFICLTTRSVHVEVAPDLSTDAFLNALKRFLSRRGTVEKLFSDNGTNFIGARSYLDELHSFLLSQTFTEHWNCELANQRIQWEMIPPNAPHFGGGWEATVKSFKTHLTRVIGAQVLTYEELLTVLCQIEAVLNSRPLGRMLSPDPSEPVALTPAHFLHTVPLQSLPAASVVDERDNLLSRYLLLDKLVQSYWRRWSVEYLHTLQERGKWLNDTKPIEKGTVVLIMQSNASPLHWPLGIVMETYPGSDRRTRVVRIKTKTGTLMRPIVKLCPLPTQ